MGAANQGTAGDLRKEQHKVKYLRDGCADVDTALALTGYGKFHYKITAVSALCLLTNGVQNGLSSYVFPAAQCDLDLTSKQIGYLNVSFLIGGICSAFLWGVIADLFGRRKVLLVTLFSNSVTTLTSAGMQSFTGLAVCRFFNGFLIGAPGSIIFNYIAEFHAPKHRLKSVCYSGMYFTAAWLFLPILSYLVIPLPDINIHKNIIVQSWRLFLITVAITEIIAATCLHFMPESPKFLAEKGDLNEALNVLSMMHATNKSTDRANYPVKSLTLSSNETKGVVCSGKLLRIVGEMIMQMKKLFQPPIVSSTVLICAVMFCNMFGYFGLGLWLPELFERFEKYHELYPNKTITVKHLASLQHNKTECSKEFDTTLLYSTLAFGGTSFMSNLLSGCVSGKVAIRTIPLVTMLIGGIASGCIYWLKTSWQHLIVACIFQGAMATGNVAIGSVTVELFPTSVAAMALCLVISVGRIGAMISNFMFGWYMDSRCEIPIFCVSAAGVCGALLCFAIRRKTNQERKDDKCSINAISNVDLA